MNGVHASDGDPTSSISLLAHSHMTNPSRHQTIRRSGLALCLALVCACAKPARTTADPEAEFRARLGQQWALVSLGSLEIPPPPPGTPPDTPGKDLVPGQRPTIRFVADPPSAGGRSFCNGYGGPYVVRGDSLRIEQIMSSAVGCDSVDSLETRFFRGLRETRRFQLDSAALILITEDGTRLTFVPVAPDSADR
jgi:heat shock protein HslJ